MIMFLPKNCILGPKKWTPLPIDPVTELLENKSTENFRGRGTFRGRVRSRGRGRGRGRGGRGKYQISSCRFVFCSDSCSKPSLLLRY